MAEHLDWETPSGLRVLARPPAAARLRPEGNDSGMAAGSSGRYRLFPYLGRREALTGWGTANMNDVAHKNRSREETEVPSLKRKEYEHKLRKLHIELVKLQEWVKHEGKKV